MLRNSLFYRSNPFFCFHISAYLQLTHFYWYLFVTGRIFVAYNISLRKKIIAKNGSSLHEITSLSEIWVLLLSFFLQIINAVTCQGCTVHTTCDHSSCLWIQIQNRDRRDYRKGDLQLILTWTMRASSLESLLMWGGITCVIWGNVSQRNMQIVWSKRVVWHTL